MRGSIRTQLKIKKVRTLMRMYAWKRSLPEPTPEMHKDDFYQWSCIKWAISEAIDEVRKSPYPPSEAMERFIRKMDEYSTRDSVHDRMFSIAHDALLDLYDKVFL